MEALLEEAIVAGQRPYEFVQGGRSAEFRLDLPGGEMAVLAKGRRVTAAGQLYDRLRSTKRPNDLAF